MKYLPQSTRRVAMDGSWRAREWRQQPEAFTKASPTGCFSILQAGKLS